MKKRNFLLLSALSLMSLVGCKLPDIRLSSTSTVSHTTHTSTDEGSVSSEDTSINENENSSEEEISSGNNENTSIEKESVNSSEDNDSSVSSIDESPVYKTADFTKGKAKNVHDLYYYEDGMPTLGNPKVLVIPVDFSDYDASTLGYTTETLEKAFNTGTEEELEYVNVAKYFKESSYNQLNIDFDVYPSWVRMSKAYTEYESMTRAMDISGCKGEDSSAANEQVILNEALAYLDDNGVDLSQYDSDSNGTIDAVILISAANIDANNDANVAENLGWAWRYWNYLGNPSSKSTEYYNGYNYYKYDGVYANDYLWASYEFLFEGRDKIGNTYFTYKDHINTYTYIHEFSHVLGADDYYDTEYDDDAEKTLYGYDIMDNASGDHAPYTKYLYGWITNAKLVYTDTTLTIGDYISTGDTIILSNNYDASKGMFQDYWVLCYYTNTGLNYDADNEYVGLFSKDGLLTYHVNSSITYNSTYKGYFLDNTNDASCSKKLIKYVKTTNDHFLLQPASEGDTSNANAKDDSSRKIPFTYSVEKMGDGEMTIKFTKNS